MSTTPTVIILAEPTPEQPRVRADSSSPMASFGVLDTLLRRVLGADLPMLLVAPPDQADAALALIPQNDILVVSPPPLLHSRGDWLVRSMSAGIMARALSPGWIILPADMPMLQAATLHGLAHGLAQGPIAYPCHRHLRGHPVGFSSELYSELIRVDSEQDLRRLTARYPAVDVDVDDPGIHMSLESQAGLDQLRAHLAGPHHGVRALRPVN